MRRDEAEVFHATDRTVAYLGQNEALIDRVVTRAAFEKLVECRDRMFEHIRTQESSNRAAREATAVLRALRKELVEDHMLPISILATGKLPWVEGIDTSFPLVSVRTRYGRLIYIGHGMAGAAAPHAAILIAAGLRPDFIERLIEATERLEAALVHHGMVIADRIVARRGIRRQARVARTMLHFVRTQVRGVLRSNPEALAGWLSITRIASSRRKAPALPAGTTPALLPASTSGSTSSLVEAAPKELPALMAPVSVYMAAGAEESSGAEQGTPGGLRPRGWRALIAAVSGRPDVEGRG